MNDSYCSNFTFIAKMKISEPGGGISTLSSIRRSILGHW